ncbi:hypothetical protein B0O80DRAFT_424308 [Mortierella sp. GBAus27b]|nr:hypothetical protein B0O80DRAFT_424308 [Mortierella sp. GBAus27b]
MRISSGITSLLFLITAAAQSWPANTDCATSPTDFNVSGFAFSIYPMCIAQPICFTATGSLLAPIMHGTNLTKVSFVGRYLGRVLYLDEQNLCDNLAAQGQPCPVPVGTTFLTTCFRIRDNFPPNIPMKFELRLTNGNGNTIFCRNATMTAMTCA